MTEHDIRVHGIIAMHYKKPKGVICRDNETQHSCPLDGATRVMYPDGYVARGTMPKVQVSTAIEVEEATFDAQKRCDERWKPLAAEFPELDLWVPKSRVDDTEAALRNGTPAANINLHYYGETSFYARHVGRF